MSAIGLRSDTVTRPSAAMRRPMAEAEVGDDVLDGDPTTRRLEQRIATLLGTEDALFFPSGTQANQTGVALCTTPRTELILEANAHLVHHELAGVAANSGVQIRPVATPDGLLTADLIRAALRPASPHVPRFSAVAVENTHNAAGGKVMAAAVSADIVTAARTAGLSVHLDGARLSNAATELAVPPATLTPGAATVMVSLSKALGCPVGSCLGSGESSEGAPGRSASASVGGCASRASLPPQGCMLWSTIWPASRRITAMPSCWRSDCPNVRGSGPPTPRRTS